MTPLGRLCLIPPYLTRSSLLLILYTEHLENFVQTEGSVAQQKSGSQHPRAGHAVCGDDSALPIDLGAPPLKTRKASLCGREGSVLKEVQMVCPNGQQKSKNTTKPPRKRVSSWSFNTG